MSYGNPESMLLELATAWGGHLEMNGTLAYEKGQRINDISVERPSMQTSYYLGEVNIWLMTEIIDEPVDGEHIGKLLLRMNVKGRAKYYRKYEKNLEMLREKYGINRIGNPKYKTPRSAHLLEILSRTQQVCAYTLHAYFIERYSTSVDSR